jgi:hypothetical protein
LQRRRAAVLQPGGEAGLVAQAEDLVLLRAAQVAVHQDHLVAGLRHHHGQVGHRSALLLGAVHRRHQERGQLLAQARKLQAGAQTLKRLGHRAVRVGQGRKIVHASCSSFSQANG